MARMSRFHREGRGSIPRIGTFTINLFSANFVIRILIESPRFESWLREFLSGVMVNILNNQGKLF